MLAVREKRSRRPVQRGSPGIPASPGRPSWDSAIAWIDCETEIVHEVGDHYFVVGRVVVDGAIAEDDPQPLLFYRGKLSPSHGD